MHIWISKRVIFAFSQSFCLDFKQLAIWICIAQIAKATIPTKFSRQIAQSRSCCKKSRHFPVANFITVSVNYAKEHLQCFCPLIYKFVKLQIKVVSTLLFFTQENSNISIKVNFYIFITNNWNTAPCA